MRYLYAYRCISYIYEKLVYGWTLSRLINTCLYMGVLIILIALIKGDLFRSRGNNLLQDDVFV